MRPRRRDRAEHPGGHNAGTAARATQGAPRGRQCPVSDEQIDPEVTARTLAAWRSALEDTRDDERERHLDLDEESGRLVALVRQALDEGGAALPPDDVARIEELTGIDAEYGESN